MILRVCRQPMCVCVCVQGAGGGVVCLFKPHHPDLGSYFLFCEPVQSWTHLIQLPLCAYCSSTSRARTHTLSCISRWRQRDYTEIYQSCLNQTLKLYWWCLAGQGLCLPLKVIPCWQMMAKRHCYVISCRLAHWHVCWSYKHCNITVLTIQICLYLCAHM